MKKLPISSAGSRAQGGFTLVEMLVSVALFSVVMVVALGALLFMSVAIRRAQAINSLINNLSSGLESMSRSVRTGTTYHCGAGGVLTSPQDCVAPNPDSFFTYLAFDGTPVSYCLSDPSSPPTAPTCYADTPNTTCPVGMSCTILRSLNGSPYSRLTSPEVQIKFFGYYVEGALLGDNKQPKATIIISGTVPVTSGQNSTFNIQTSITQRIYDL